MGWGPREAGERDRRGGGVGVRYWFWCNSAQVSFTPNFRLLTQFLKILELLYVDLNFQVFWKNKNPRSSIFCREFVVPKSGAEKKLAILLETFRKMYKRLIWATKNWTFSTTSFHFFQICRNWAIMKFWIWVVMIFRLWN